MSYKKCLFVIFLSLSIAACAHWRHAREKYTYTDKAQVTAPALKVPKDLKNFKSESYYPLPKISKAEQKPRVNPKELLIPPGSSVAKQRNKQEKQVITTTVLKQSQIRHKAK